MKESPQDVVAKARRINDAWITHGELAANTRRYLDHLATTDPQRLKAACSLAITKSRQASHEQQDPKLPFYAALFSHSTKTERDHYLKDHFFTRLLSAEMQLTESTDPNP